MKIRMKQSLLAGATIATLGLGFAGAGMASAATNASSEQSSLVDKLASTFNLDKSKIQAVFTADRQEHQTQMEADQAANLTHAVTDGKLTQAQADYITNAQKEIQTLMSASDPDSQTDDQSTAIKTKMDALRTWATNNNVDGQYLGGHGGGHGGPGGGMRPGDDTSSDSSSSSSN